MSSKLERALLHDLASAVHMLLVTVPPNEQLAEARQSIHSALALVEVEWAVIPAERS